LVYDGTNAVASSAGTVEFASPPPIGSTTPNTGAFTTLSATGTSTLANVTGGAANTLNVNTIKQQAGTAFSLADPLGVTHVFISSSSPYTNTFINGNGGGVVFLGSAAKTSVADTTGIITMSGATSGTTSITPSAIASGTLTLPAATDTLIGKATTDTLTNKTLTSPIISTGVSQGSGFKHQRFGATCTTGATAGNTCTTVLTWTSAFADANYTVTCWGSTPTGTLPVMAENAAHTASAVTIVLQTEFNIASSYGAVDCIAIHD
jgi:hypothetical protein